MFKKGLGFTLIELIIVIGLLSTIITVLVVIINPLGQFQKTRDAQRKSDLSEVQTALELYYQDNNSYPSESAYKILGIDWGTSWGPYISLLPKDPLSTNTYIYYTPANGQSYFLYANLERGSQDPQACNSGEACSSVSTNGIVSTVCGGVCNFGLTSPNESP